MNEGPTIPKAVERGYYREELPSCRHEPYQGRCAHCDVEFKNGLPVNALPRLLADAKLGQLVREAGPEVVVAVARTLDTVDLTFSDDRSRDRARAVLRTLRELSE